MPPPELEPIPEGSRPEGSVIGNFSASTMEVDGGHTLEYHRPHAFALMHGDNGAKIAYGQLLWRVDRVDFAFAANSGEDPITTVGKCTGAGQTRAIKGLDVVIPTLNDPNGDAMDPTTPNIYHQLDGYGAVYLVWHVELDESEILTECWVEVTQTVDGEEVGATATNDIDTVATTNTDHDRFAGAGVGVDSSGIYRIKLGTVNEDELVTQDISTDVYWSTVVLTRDQAS